MRKKGGKRSGKEIFSTIFFVLFAMSWGILFSHALNTRNDKVIRMRDDLIFNYYDQSKITEVLEKNLGDHYTGNLRADFDNFIISEVMNELSQVEDEKWKRYNAFLSKDFIEKYEDSGKKQASEIYGKSLDENTYYVDIKDFCDDVTYERVQSYIPEMKLYKNLVIDLRNNSGGPLGELRKVADIFLDQDQVVYKLKCSDSEKVVRSKNKKQVEFEKIVLLTNHKTASASELLILALKENLKDVVTIGTTTYGKGRSFGMRKFKDGTGMIFLSAVTLGPKSSQIPMNGLKPDIEVGHEKEYYMDIADERELEKVLEIDAELQMEAAQYYLKNLD